MQVIPIDRYFDEMDLTDDQKERRKKIAKTLEEQFILIFALISVSKEFSKVNWENIQQKIVLAYITALGGDDEVDEDLKIYIEGIALALIDETLAKIDEEYTLSNDRATNIAEQETSTIVNYQESVEAKENGFTYKQWITQKDRWVRHTHRQVDNKKIPIDEYFTVGESLMSYPRDTKGELKEILGCRCTIRYTNS